MRDANALIILTGIWQRPYQKYGDFSYLLGTLEAGHVAQNLLLTSTSLGVATRPFEGFDDKALSEAFDLPMYEQIVYVIALGR